LLDGILVVFSLKLAQIIRPRLSGLAVWIRDILSPPDIPFYNYILFALIWVVVFLILSLYDSHKYLERLELLGAYFGVSLLALIIIPGFLYFVNRDLSRVLFVSFAVIATILLKKLKLCLREKMLTRKFLIV
jgi:hypothetical protein